ncbi:MAG: bifunctional helix-turn-helix domain-containing protein/methylated-DNA--[protein]-cysteine S-methyltransferase [Desulfobacterales bacterium]|nr:bifunctional helix-turn-helix domain-containing protein/methylated-DNA--[protein]-cysteine S-methyltransferase [Desulfobacterales bacterium]
MSNLEQLCRDYARVENAIWFLEENFDRQPALEEIAMHVNLSEFHFQRLFSRWVGISPKRFLQFLTKEYAKNLLEGSDNLLNIAFDAGLSGPGRLHDLFVSCEAVTPGEYKAKGQGIRIAYGFHPSPFGECLLATTTRGICALNFVQNDNHESLIRRLNQRWQHAQVVQADRETQPLVDRIFAFDAGSRQAPLHLYIRGTNFQIKVWEALLKIPMGKAVTYEDIARHIGLPRAARAVGNAVGRNPVPFLIPCHRVIRKMGAFGNYGEGPTRKKAILGWEAAQIITDPSMVSQMQVG